jgi:membrane protease YdiL (CAAX protease family)
LVLQLLPGILCGYFLDSGSLVAHPNDPQSSPAETWDYGRAMLPWIAASHGASLVIVCLVFRWSMGPSWPRRLGLRRPTFYHVMLAILGLPGMIMVAGAAFQAALRWLPELYDFQSDLQSMAALPWYYAVLLVGVGPGIDEELWYRGFLGRGLVSRYGALVGILLTSFFFGLVHVDPRHAVVAFTMGTFLHLAYLASGSIWIPILMHTLNNTLSMAAMSVESTAAAADTVAVIPWTSYGGGVFLLSAIGWCFFKTRFRPAVQRKIGESSFPEADTADDTPLAARPSLSDWLLPPAAFIAFLSLLST